MVFSGNAELVATIDMYYRRADHSKAQEAERSRTLKETLKICERRKAYVQRAEGHLRNVQQEVEALQELLKGEHNENRTEGENEEIARALKAAREETQNFARRAYESKREAFEFAQFAYESAQQARESAQQVCQSARVAYELTRQITAMNHSHAELLYRFLVQIGLDGVSGSVQRGSVFARFCEVVAFDDLSARLRERIREARKNLGRESDSMVPTDYGSVYPENKLTGCWVSLLQDMDLQHHFVLNTSNRKLFGSHDKPDISIVHRGALRAHLVRGRRRENSVHSSSVEHEYKLELGDDDAELIGWGSVDVVLELKTKISEDGEKLGDLGKQAASQAYQRLVHMRHYPFAVIADSEYMMFFHSSGSPSSTQWEAMRKAFWRRTQLVPIKDGLQHLRELLLALHYDWIKENSLIQKRLALLEEVSSGLTGFHLIEQPRAIEILNISHKECGGANVFVLKGRKNADAAVAKIICLEDLHGNPGYRAERNLDRERRRLLALEKANIENIPVIRKHGRAERREGFEGDQTKGLLKWRTKGGRRYIALVLEPFASGGTLEEQRCLLHSRENGGNTLCRIIWQVARSLLRVHQATVAKEECSIHGDIKPSNIVLMQTVVESECPLAILIDWEHSMRLREEYASKSGSVSGESRKVAQISPQKDTDTAESAPANEEGMDYLSPFTPAFCARKQHELISSTKVPMFGPEVDWEALFFTFFFMIDRQRMPWLWFDENEDGSSLSLRSMKGEFLYRCQKGIWDVPNLEEPWCFTQWTSDSVSKIKELTRTWASLIIEEKYKQEEVLRMLGAF